jgi:hypothetical protein
MNTKTVLLFAILVNILSCSGDIEKIDAVDSWVFGSRYDIIRNEDIFYVGTRSREENTYLCFIFTIDPPNHELVIIGADVTPTIDIRFDTAPAKRWRVREANQTTGIAIEEPRAFVDSPQSLIGVRYMKKNFPVVATFDITGFRLLESMYFQYLEGWN